MHALNRPWYGRLTMRYVFGDYALDDQLYELQRIGEPVELERKVFDVLVYLIQHHDRLVTKDELLEQLWPEQVVGEAALTRCITSARKALGDDGNRQEFIKTQHGRGYRFVASVAPVPRSEFQVPRQQEAISRQPSQVDNISTNTSELDGDGVIPTQAGLQVNEPPHTGHEQERYAFSPTPSRSRRRLILLLGLLLLIGIVIVAEWRFVRSLNSPSPPASNSTALPLPDKPSIAVLPFITFSEDPQQEYFGDGLSADLIVDLSKLSDLIVIARQSTLIYKDKLVNMQTVSKDLGVRYVVEGSVRKVGDHLLITAQLADGNTGRHIWAERYDRLPQDLFSVQEEVRRKILVHLGLKLTPEGEERLQRVYTPNLEAYNNYAHALVSYLRLTPADNTEARQLCEKAIALDPSYAAAYSLMGLTYWAEWGAQWSTDPHELEQAFTLAQKALALDDSLPPAHELLGAVYLWRDKQHDQVLAEVKRALAQSPNWLSAYIMLANILVFAGRPEETIANAESALRIGPRSLYYLIPLGQAYYLTRRYDEAIATYQKILAVMPRNPWAHRGLAAVYSELGREAEARAEAAEALQLSPQFSLEAAQQRMPYKNPAVLERHLTALRKAGLK